MAGTFGHRLHAEAVELRLSNLMAFDATAQGNWGCLPEHYPAVLELVLARKVAIEPFIEQRPLATINDVSELRARHTSRAASSSIPES